MLRTPVLAAVRAHPVLVRWALLGAVAAAVFLVFFFNLNGTGLLGPDEPRYAAIGREMARSGDWLTPRLWGEPWFEKPPLIYWMTALGFRAGLGDETASRVPVAFTSVAFLAFFFLILKRAALAPEYSTAILATMVGWLAFSHIGATDLPMAAAFSAAMLLAMRWLDDGDRRVLTPAAALLGFAVLAKGLVPLVLALPAVWMGRRRLADVLRPAPVAAFLLVATPWYAAMTVRYGGSFLEEFFWRHHLERFASDVLQHRQPAWFYVPVLLAGLLPWTPLVALLFQRGLYRDRRCRFLMLWVLFGLVFFSLSANKLPGYLLPLLPAAAVLLGTALAEAGNARWPLAACAMLLAAVPVAAAILPAALQRGITYTRPAGVPWAALALAAGLAVLVWLLERAGRRGIAAATLVAATLAAVLWFERATFAALDRTVSARAFWREVVPRREQVCVAEVNRSWRYNLNYYSVTPLPGCTDSPRPFRIVQDASGGARLLGQ